MQNISNQFAVNRTTTADAARAYAKNNDLGFAQLMNERSTGINGLVTTMRPDINPALTVALGGLVGAYGIPVPPRLRIFASKKGFRLEEGDERNGKFEQLLDDHTGVADLLSQTQTQALSARDVAMQAAIDRFSKGNACGYDMQGLLIVFRENEKPRAVCIVYDGNSTQVEEREGNNWRPVKNEADFTADLVRAYTRYALTQTATAERDAKARLTHSLAAIPPESPSHQQQDL